MNLREVRISHGLTQLDIAKAVNVTEQTVRNWERGAMSPSQDNEKKLVDYFEQLNGDKGDA